MAVAIRKMRRAWSAVVVIAACGGAGNAGGAQSPASSASAREPVENRATPATQTAGEAALELEMARNEEEHAATLLHEALRRLARHDEKIATIADEVANARSEAERTAAARKLDLFEEIRIEHAAEVEAARAEYHRAMRRRGALISPRCAKDPLARGCE